MNISTNLQIMPNYTFQKATNSNYSASTHLISKSDSVTFGGKSGPADEAYKAVKAIFKTMDERQVGGVKDYAGNVYSSICIGGDHKLYKIFVEAPKTRVEPEAGINTTIYAEINDQGQHCIGLSQEHPNKGILSMLGRNKSFYHEKATTEDYTTILDITGAMKRMLGIE